MTNLNNIYNTMNVSWKKGKEIKLNVNKTDEELAKTYEVSQVRDHILEQLTIQSDYNPNQYYMIIAPALSVAGFAPAGLDDNWFFVRASFQSDGVDIAPSHELGHCNGLDEFAVDIGAATRAESINKPVQYQSTNVMGYSKTSSRHLKDFFSWQIPVIRNRIQEQLKK